MVDHAATTTTDRGSPVLERLAARGWEFDFLQAVWLLERLDDGASRVGGREPAAGETIRFRPDVSLGFPATDVRRVAVRRGAGGGDRYHLDVTFMGLYGVSTPLPLHYAIGILRSVDPYTPSPAPAAEPQPAGPGARMATDSNPVRDFLDLLHHRLVSLFYRGMVKYRYDLTFGLPDRGVITDYLLWLTGHSPEANARVVGVDPIRMIRYAGILTQHPRSAATLEGMLSDYWDGLPVDVESFVGRWVALGPADLNRIGRMNSSLGADLTVGEQVYDLSGAFRVRVGPVDWATYLAFLPDGAAHARTRSLVRLYAADPLSFSVEVRLHANQVPPARLASDEAAGRLGYTSWVRTEEVRATSVIFDESSLRPMRVEEQ